MSKRDKNEQFVINVISGMNVLSIKSCNTE